MPVFSNPYSEGFESGVGGWVGTSGLALTAEPPSTAGTNGLLISRVADNGVDEVVSITFTGLTPGRGYRSTFSIHNPQAGGLLFNVGWDSEWYLWAYADNGWRTWTTEFTATTASHTFMIRVWNQNSLGGLSVGDEFSIDAVTVTEFASVTENIESGTVGDPHDTIDRFGGTGGTIDDTRAHSGTKSIRCTGAATTGATFYARSVNWYPYYELLWGRSVTVTAWVWVQTGTIRLAAHNDNFNLDLVSDISTTTGAWEQLSITVTPEMMADGVLWWSWMIGPDSPNAAFDYWLDDLVITWDDTQAGEGDLGLNTMDYSWATDPVDLPIDRGGGATYSLVTTPALGTRSLKVDSPVETAATSFWDTTYVISYTYATRSIVDNPVKISYQVYVEPGGGTVSLSHFVTDEFASVVETVTTTTTGAWETLTLEVSIAEVRNQYIVLHVTDPSVATVFYADSFIATGDTANRITIPVNLSGDAYIDGPVPVNGAMPAALNLSGTAYFTGTLNNTGEVTIGVGMAATPSYVGPVLADGALSIGVDMAATGSYTGPIHVSGVIEVWVDPYSQGDTPVDSYGPLGWKARRCDVVQAATGPTITISPRPSSKGEAYVERTYYGLDFERLYEFRYRVSRGVDAAPGVDVVVSAGTDTHYPIHSPNDYKARQWISDEDSGLITLDAWSITRGNDYCVTVRIHVNNEDPWDPGEYDDWPAGVPITITDLGYRVKPYYESSDGSIIVEVFGGWGMDAGLTTSLSTEQAHSGTQSTKFEYTANLTPPYDTILAGQTLGWQVTADEMIPFAPSCDFAVSVWVYVPAGNPPARMELYHGLWWYEGPRTYVESTMTDTWEQLTLYVHNDFYAAYRYGHGNLVPIAIGTSDNVNATYYWDDLTVTWIDSTSRANTTFLADGYLLGYNAFELDLPFFTMPLDDHDAGQTDDTYIIGGGGG